jgi:hypothetical protein
MPILPDPLTISIASSNGISPLFIRANTALLEKNQQLIAECDSDNLKKSLIEDLWVQTYYARLIRDNTDTWSYILFSNQQDLSMFLLKWSD